MRNVAICGRGAPALAGAADHFDTLEIEGVSVLCGLIHNDGPAFDPLAAENAGRVLVRVAAFSCNYRDKGIVLGMALKGGDSSYMAVGSELVGQIVEVGRDVVGLAPGDRVIGNAAFPGERGGAPGGLTTNHASREYLVLHAAKVMKIPSEMSDEVAAGFSVGAQTTYGMIRRLALRPGANVLVTAASSNTSLFAISALARHGANVYATTTRPRHEAELARLGLRELVPLSCADRLVEIAKYLGGFDAIVDPFCDVHFPRLSRTLAPGGRYITCGIHDQTEKLLGRARPEPWDPQKLIFGLIFGNVELMGNCLGSSQDLADAIADWRADRLDVVVDSVWSGREVGGFFRRTFADPDRFGKVVYRYEAS
jgi:NADPH:quinone reductase-like Zn-dependent oxidoreductase